MISKPSTSQKRELLVSKKEKNGGGRKESDTN